MTTGDAVEPLLMTTGRADVGTLPDDQLVGANQSMVPAPPVQVWAKAGDDAANPASAVPARSPGTSLQYPISFVAVPPARAQVRRSARIPVPPHPACGAAPL
ncbi:MAG: hypothetical protein BGO82_18605 [Devosia sp. 67-54]|nr:MAG: hypothetical protein BGO82_18605 [Devosia sp. 67-54]